ncbi:8-oxo-dGTP diphosphatase MutT [Microbulbifer thermotolerans]|uniref:8-oxo-dGTP diphosphatase n=1 Tax=Microbulbifer thermotolerans TaxID=252514 RepID=A0AB35HTY2_MICTH|nr:8-oxo-dGTP diphosphatase MutT [Microbulbifer thermotolerans]MCX2800635.1 8-oxo-dGTP diphosphatase MutT [Microbulbifer thermotolerans]MCX2830104.1 8-oxo-dGTP diphosphatase MutT [Microbulbifer thermotolerans]
MGKVVHVAVGVVRRKDGKILIARRPEHLHMGGRWEFPGGKVEAGETVQQALTRELREEVAIEVTGLRPLTKIRHTYAEKTVLLDTWWVTEFRGEAKGLEGQQTTWVEVVDLNSYQFPDANQGIIQAIREAENCC